MAQSDRGGRSWAGAATTPPVTVPPASHQWTPTPYTPAAPRAQWGTLTPETPRRPLIRLTDSSHSIFSPATQPEPSHCRYAARRQPSSGPAAAGTASLRAAGSESTPAAVRAARRRQPAVMAAGDNRPERADHPSPKTVGSATAAQPGERAVGAAAERARHASSSGRRLRRGGGGLRARCAGGIGADQSPTVGGVAGRRVTGYGALKWRGRRRRRPARDRRGARVERIEPTDVRLPGSGKAQTGVRRTGSARTDPVPTDRSADPPITTPAGVAAIRREGTVRAAG